MTMNKQQIIATLGLEQHIEGGYFRRTYQHRSNTASAGGARPLMSSIYYLLTDDQPVDHFHVNRSDILHYFHAGAPITYYLIDDSGRLETHVLGLDLAAGQRPQLLVPGGTWKACELKTGEFGLISEAVAPGFDYADMQLISSQQFNTRGAHHLAMLGHLLQGA